MTSQDPLNMEQLGEAYEVIGELSGREDARTFIGKRREDGVDVLITVIQTPSGDEGNALSHWAADTNLLSGNGHRSVLPIIEGRWIGADVFAVITERVYAPTLEELLSRRDEQFDYPRIATILREVNGALEWARAQKVVHRAVALDTVFLEPGTDRVLVSFAARPLPLSDMPGPEDDATTIAVLARAMLTRSAAAPERANRPLAELRPGLPGKVIEQTEGLLQLSRTSEKVPDISGYIAAIAMADALKEGEIHLEKSRHVIEEQERSHRVQLEKERKEHDDHLAAEKKAHERDVTEQAKRFQKESEEFERQLAKERQALAKEREALTKEQAAHATDRAALIEEREAHEREVADVRERLEWETAALTTQVEQYARTAELATPVGEQTPVAIPMAPRLSGGPRTSRPSGPGWWTRAWQKRPRWSRPSWNQKWSKPAAAAGLVLLLGASAIAFGRSRDASKGPRLARSAPASAARVVDSVAGGIEAPAIAPVGSPLNVPVDLIMGVASRAASAPPPRPRPVRLVRPQPVTPTLDTSLVARPDSAPRVDTVFGYARPAARTDSVVMRDSVARPKPDSVPKRDSMPRDTLIRRDTMELRTGQR
ncbi:MAG: hypothetical protein WD825_10900 [Gemmatimonadaceae bacterium]